MSTQRWAPFFLYELPNRVLLGILRILILLEIPKVYGIFLGYNVSLQLRDRRSHIEFFSVAFLGILRAGSSGLTA